MAPPLFTPPQITGQQTWKPFDTSGVWYDWTKLQTWPDSLEECEGYRERDDTENGLEVERVFLCNWSELASVVQWALGYSYLAEQTQLNTRILDPNGNPGQRILKGGGGPPPLPQQGLRRVTPLQDPYRPYLYASRYELLETAGAWTQDPGLYLTDPLGNQLDQSGNLLGLNAQPVRIPAIVFAEVSGIGQPGPAQLQGGGAPPPPGQEPPPPPPSGTWSEGKARFKLAFRQRDYIVMTDAQAAGYDQGELVRYVERRPHYAIQGLPLANIAKAGPKQLKFAEGPQGVLGAPIPEAGIMLLPTASYEYTWHELPFWPTAAITACQGKVNADWFDGVQGWPKFPPQTLLCQAPDISMRRTRCGQFGFRAKYILDFRPDGWNKFPDGTGVMRLATFGGDPAAADGSNLVFKPADFGKLFQIAGASPWG